MNKGDHEDFENSAKCCNNSYVHDDAKVRNHCHITGKYRDFSH